MDPETRKQAEYLRAIANDEEFFKENMTKKEFLKSDSSDEGGLDEFYDEHLKEL